MTKSMTTDGLGYKNIFRRSDFIDSPVIDDTEGLLLPPKEGWGAWLVYQQGAGSESNPWRCGLSLHGHVLAEPPPPGQRLTKYSTGWVELTEDTMVILDQHKAMLMTHLGTEHKHCLKSLLERNLMPTKEELESALVVDALADWDDEKEKFPGLDKIINTGYTSFGKALSLGKVHARCDVTIHDDVEHTYGPALVPPPPMPSYNDAWLEKFQTTLFKVFGIDKKEITDEK